MKRNWFAITALVGAASLLCSISSCGRSSELVAITIQPATETFGASNIMVIDDEGSSVNLRALGTYIHPPVTKDITSQVTWTSNDTQMVTVDSTGLLTATGLACGSTLVSATVTTNSSAGGVSSTGAVVTGSMTASVVCFTGTGPTLTLDFAGSGSGTVASSPAGLSCASSAITCSASFTSGTTITLTASASGTFGGWSSGSCDSESGQICTIDLTADRTVTATFD